jgi:hypothetical protein
VIRRLLFSPVLAALLAVSGPVQAQDQVLPVDRNSQEVRDAQKQCTEELKQKLLDEKVKKTAWGAEEEAFQRCKTITGWQSPQ